MFLGRVPEKYQRSTDYRCQFINWHPGIFRKYYICAYCGKIITKNRMEVDHVIPVDAARKNLFARWFLPNGVNVKRNMVSACHNCNRRKSNKGGLWIARGITGKFVQPVIWILLILFLFAFFWNFFVVGYSKMDAREQIYSIFLWGKNLFIRFRFPCNIGNGIFQHL